MKKVAFKHFIDTCYFEDDRKVEIKRSINLTSIQIHLQVLHFITFFTFLILTPAFVSSPFPGYLL